MRKKKKELKKEVDVTPINKIKISILDDKELISEFEVDYPCKEFKFDCNTGKINSEKGKTYFIDNDLIYLKFLKEGYIPHLVYNYKKTNPINFKNTNKSIPARALKLLWNTSMYKILFTPEMDSTNKLIVIGLLAGIIVQAITLYLKYGR